MDADILRIILAVFGALVIAGLYFWERRRRRRDHEEADDADFQNMEEEGGEDKREPRLGPWDGYGDAGEDQAVGGIRAGDMDDVQSGDAVPSRDGGGGDGGSLDEAQVRLRHSALDHEPPPAPVEPPPPQFPPGPLILTLHVAAVAASFDGAAIVHAAGHRGLEPGEMDIFHCTDGDGDQRRTLFSMANMVKPGTFPFGALAEFRSPGLTLFAQLDGTPDDSGRMEELLGTAHALAKELGGEVRDESRQPLAPEGERLLRERVMTFVEVRQAADDQ